MGHQKRRSGRAPRVPIPRATGARPAVPGCGIRTRLWVPEIERSGLGTLGHPHEDHVRSTAGGNLVGFQSWPVCLAVGSRNLEVVVLRTVYPEWYAHDDSALADIVTAGTIALDTNVLLSLYRISATARDEVVRILTADLVRTRLFMPYQVGLEYQRNRVTTARGQRAGYSEVKKGIDEVSRSLSGLTVNADAGLIRDDSVRAEVNAAIADSVQLVATELDKLKQKIDAISTTHLLSDELIKHADPVRTAIEKMFTDPTQVGTKPDSTRLAELKKQATERYKTKTPPGYEDASGSNKKEDPSGDYLIWRELLDRAAATDSAILFVTDDKKPDWYELDKRNIRGPRPELRVEMAEISGQPYHQTTLQGFLWLAQKYLSLSVDEDTVNQVESASPPRSTPASDGGRAAVPLALWEVVNNHPELATLDSSGVKRFVSDEAWDTAALIRAVEAVVAPVSDSASSAIRSRLKQIVTRSLESPELVGERNTTSRLGKYEDVRDPSTEVHRPLSESQD